MSRLHTLSQLPCLVTDRAGALRDCHLELAPVFLLAALLLAVVVRLTTARRRRRSGGRRVS